MPARSCPTVLLAFVVLFGLGGCSSNFKFSDSDYRPWVIRKRSIAASDRKERHQWK